MWKISWLEMLGTSNGRKPTQIFGESHGKRPLPSLGTLRSYCCASDEEDDKSV